MFILTSAWVKKDNFKNKKIFKPSLFQKIKNIEFNYNANSKALMTAKRFKKEILEFDGELTVSERKMILILDNCTAHPNLNPLLEQIIMVFLPPNSTCIIQPLNMGIVRSFKSFYRKDFLRKIVMCID